MLRGGAVVETQHPAEPLDAFYRASGRFREAIGLDQPILESLVIPLPVIMSGVLASRLPKRAFPEEDHPTEALILDRPDEPLGVGIGLGCRMHPMRIVSNDVFG